MIGSGAEPSGDRRAVQAGTARRRRFSASGTLVSGVLSALSLPLLLGACASAPPAINPVDWYHGMEGGPIAAKRAPIPGAQAPYPNLANVPQAPKLIDPAERDRISAELLAERTRAQQQAALAPVPPATNPPAANGASNPAVGPAAPAAPAEVNAGAASPPAGGPAPAPNQASPPPSATLAAAAAALPGVPAAPPPPPAFAGFPVPGPPPTPFGLAAPAALTLPFPAGSAALSAAARARLSRLAAVRGKASIAVVGYGDATESSAAAQSAALHLGLARASAVATALAADGVPASALRLGAEASAPEASGGATLRLLAEPGSVPATGT